MEQKKPKYAVFLFGKKNSYKTVDELQLAHSNGANDVLVVTAPYDSDEDDCHPVIKARNLGLKILEDLTDYTKTWYNLF